MLDILKSPLTGKYYIVRYNDKGKEKERRDITEFIEKIKENK